MAQPAQLADEQGTNLILDVQGDRRVHRLHGRALEAGDLIEVQLADGYWLRGRYEWSGNEARWAGLRIDLGGPWQSARVATRPPAAVMALHPDALVRWPQG